MQGLKKIGLALAIAALPGLLFMFGIIMSLRVVLGTPQPIQEALQASGLYEHGIKDALAQAQKDSRNKDNVPLSQNEIVSAITKSFPPDMLQQQTNGVINDIYDWLRGDSPHLAFNIDLAQAKANLANNLSEHTRERLASLPECAPNTPLPNGDLDPFNATCVPRGTDINAASAKVRDQLLQGEGFLKDPVITPATFKNDQGQTLEQQFHAAPDAYEQSTWIFYGMALLAILAGSGIAFLSPTWRIGVRRIGLIMLSVGIISALLAWGLNALIKAGVAKLHENQTTQPLMVRVVDVMQTLANQVQRCWLIYGIVLVAVGLAAFLTIRLWKGKAGEHPTGSQHPAPKADKPQTPTTPPLPK